MVDHRETIEIIANTLKRNTKIPDDLSYLPHEADTSGSDADVATPVLVLQAISNQRDDPSNDNFVGYITNDNDEQVGYIYESKWEMNLQMDVWTAAGSDADPDTYGKFVREVLYTYDTRGPDKTFRDEDGKPIDQIYDFMLTSRSRDDSFVETQSIRRWRQEATVRGAERLTVPAQEPPIRAIDESTST
jgi:hypothetical protein